MWVTRLPAWSCGDRLEVELAACQVGHGAEVIHVAEAAGACLEVLDDAVESFEQRVGAPVVEVGEDVVPVAAYQARERLHRLEPGVHHPRAQAPEPVLGLGAGGAVLVDVLQRLAHLAGARGPQPLQRQAALGLQLVFCQIYLRVVIS